MWSEGTSFTNDCFDITQTFLFYIVLVFVTFMSLNDSVEEKENC